MLGKLGKSHVYDTLTRYNPLIHLDDSWLSVIKEYGRIKCKTVKIADLTQNQVINLKQNFQRVEMFQNGKRVAKYEAGEKDEVAVDWSKDARIIAFDYKADMAVLFVYYSPTSDN